jgi:hypothetical protein
MRVNYFVDIRYQFRFAWYMTLGAAFTVIVFAGGIGYLATYIQNFKDTMGIEPTAEMQAFMSGSTWLFYAIFIACSALVVIGVILWSIIVSHRVAGPVYAFNRALNDLADGNLDTDLELRNKDEFGFLEDTFVRIRHLLKPEGHGTPPPGSGREKTSMATLTESASASEETSETLEDDKPKMDWKRIA